MSSPSESDIEQYLEEIANKDDQIRKLDKDINDLCDKVVPLVEKPEFRKNYYDYFENIYRCLMLHLKLHFGPNFAEHVKKNSSRYSQLQKLDNLLAVHRDSTFQEALENRCEDPGSILLKVFSDILDLEDSPKGTLSHANKVMERAGMFFVTFGAKNTFKPKVLALVSHNNSWFVGASVAVSPYVRPLVLYTRINDFNWSLKKSVIYSKALEIESNGEWSSSAFFKTENYKKKKDPCRNCMKIFGKLNGFIPENVRQEEDGANARASNGSDTFLAACAEYIPVNLLLHETDSSPDEKVVVENVLEKFHSKCLHLTTNFKNIADECRKACKKRDSVQQREIYETLVKETVHIFGVKPEFNGSLHDLASTC